MPITQAVYAVGTTLVQVVAPDTSPTRVTLHNLESTASRSFKVMQSHLSR